MELQDQKLTFLDSRQVKWVAPKGTLTDGASIPGLLVPITGDRFSSEYLKAAVVHDAYCQEENKTRTPDQYRKRTWKEVHRMFYEGILAGCTNEVLAKTMYAGILLAGPRWNDPDRENQGMSEENLTRGFIGAKQWIEKNKNATVEQMEADVERRERVLRRLNKFDIDISNAMRGPDRAHAEGLLRRQEDLLKSELEKSPDDSMLLNFKGDLHKNWAKVYGMSNRTSEVNAELISSERMYEAALKIEPKDPSALSGLGGVAILRGDLSRAENYSRRALEIAPSLHGAKRDLEKVRELRGGGLHQ